MKLRKGDLVEVTSGEDRGRRGKILRVETDQQGERVRAIVEGLNMSKRHQKARSATKPGGKIDLPSPIAVSNLVLLCPKCGKRSKVKREEHEGRLVRVCKECSEIIDV